MSAKWMRRGPFGCVAVGFACRLRDLYKAQKQSGMIPHDPADTIASTISSQDDAYHIVWLDERKVTKKTSKSHLREYLVHEAVHARQGIERRIGERMGGEIEAYVQQWLSAWLWKCWRERRKKGR